MLVSWKNEQDAVREALGSEYQDYDLVIAGPFGAPTEGSAITLAFQRLIKEHDLPKVVFIRYRKKDIVKVITGIRRCGKPVLLNEFWI